ncbi:hypothetical protein [Streptomyces rugosispiralis]|uniref:Cyclic nucleotide-binding domain-containing protein n=1 Tax=Streptomyces rugosispiralis TaxID=2967341 RepID=A0ABT1V8D1_9ACTN|nr:hypothetical protein [Streptomyces rugosispiralis]MCQ8193507.1 hypothetical protein [Streptomyces rugosispiralis]
MAPGEAIIREGGRGTDFLVVLSGTVAITEHHGTLSAAGVWEGRGHRCSVKRVTSAAGEGAMAVHHIHDHLGHTADGLTRPSGDPTPSRHSSAPGGR